MKQQSVEKHITVGIAMNYTLISRSESKFGTRQLNKKDKNKTNMILREI
jgi:hypothetical protein